MVATYQQHTTNFIEVSLKDGGKGMYNRQNAFIGYDAMYTKDRQLWLWSFHADCCPVLLYCRDQKLLLKFILDGKVLYKKLLPKSQDILLRMSIVLQSIFMHI